MCFHEQRVRCLKSVPYVKVLIITAIIYFIKKYRVNYYYLLSIVDVIIDVVLLHNTAL